MRFATILLLALIGSCQPSEISTTEPFKFDLEADEVVVKSIFDEVLKYGEAYENLRHLCKEIGPRLSGSAKAEEAVEFTAFLMKRYGFDTVYLQEVMVPKWVRRKRAEVSTTIGDRKISFRVCALGNSVGTNGILNAEVVEVRSYSELEILGREGVKGKIVFYNQAMDPTFIRTGRAYGTAGFQRWSGPSEAAKYGALASINRSLSSAVDDFPHTGSTGYKLNLPKIPGSAISTRDADFLSQLLKDNSDLLLSIEMDCGMEGEVISHNVIGEIRGTENPEKVIVVGGHLDSWDLGEGAHDDGAGCMQAIETLRLFQALKLRPKNTLRAVMFMNEENGLKGGKMYARIAEEKDEVHVAALESDGGGFTPFGFSYTLPDTAMEDRILAWKPLFEKREMFSLRRGGGGADIGPLQNQEVPLFGLYVDSQRYFYYHHTADDIFENVNDRELHLGAGALASLIFLIDKYGLKS
jgi:carboxypeptidase Q